MVIIAFLLLVLFLVWQFKMLKKYALTFDYFKLNVSERFIVVNGEQIGFDEIACVTVRELEQPSVLEKAFSKSAFYTYMAEVTFHLKSGESVHCTFNTKGVLYKTLKKLEPFVPVNGDIDYFKPHLHWGALLLLLAGFVLFFLFKK